MKQDLFRLALPLGRASSLSCSATPSPITVIWPPVRVGRFLNSPVPHLRSEVLVATIRIIGIGMGLFKTASMLDEYATILSPFAKTSNILFSGKRTHLE